jgi:diacylglycerol kinase family enzyme
MPLVILNTNARGGRAGEFEPELRDWLKRHYPGVPLHATRTVGEARAAVAEAPRGSRIALMGGDGTLHHLLGALLDGAHEVAIVALGSGEDGARAMGAHNRPWNRMLARGLRLHSAPSLVDIGWVRTEHEERPFFSSLAAGFDAAVAERALGLPAWLRGTPR